MHLTLFYLPAFSQKTITQAHRTSQPHKSSPESNQTVDFIKYTNNGVMINTWDCCPHIDALLLHAVQWGITLQIYKSFFYFMFFWNLLLNCSLLLGSTGFWKYIQHTLRLSKEAKQLFWYFTSFFCKWNAMLQLTRACWVHTWEQKGNVALFILHKWLNMIFHLCYLTFFSLKDSIASHAVVHI